MSNVLHIDFARRRISGDATPAPEHGAATGKLYQLCARLHCTRRVQLPPGVRVGDELYCSPACCSAAVGARVEQKRRERKQVREWRKT